LRHHVKTFLIRSPHKKSKLAVAVHPLFKVRIISKGYGDPKTFSRNELGEKPILILNLR
jgi:hypothetical protein